MNSRNLFKTAHPREFIWFAPFLCIGLMALGLLRPLPHLPAPAHSRTVVDASGTPVQIETPFRGTALAWGDYAGGYLEHTRAPETLLHAGGPSKRVEFSRHVTSWIYPQALAKDSIWDASMGTHNHGPYAEAETLLAYNPGVYLVTPYDFGPLLRHLGLSVLYTLWFRKAWDEGFSQARVETALIGRPERGEALIVRYCRAFAEIRQELKPAALTSRPRVLIMGSSTNDRGLLGIKSVQHPYQRFLLCAGVKNASEGWTAEQQDAERILAMDPDMVFLVGLPNGPRPAQGPQEFMDDPRWRGLKAVKDKRVYTMPGRDSGGGGLGGLIFQPLWSRWIAEIVHPDRLPPQMREVLRARLVTEFGYRLTDDQIDFLLRMRAFYEKP